ncbi:phosphoglycerate kinase [Pseudoscourfieldia marina]
MTAAAAPSSACCNKKYASCCPEKTADDENDAAHYHASKRQHEGMLREKGLPLVQDAELRGAIVLVRVDHNVVRRCAVVDSFRIDATIGTLFSIVERGGRPVIMTHVGRPKDKSGHIHASPETDVEPVVAYLERKLHIKLHVPQLTCTEGVGIVDIDTSINRALRELKAHKVGGIYLPNTRWFAGEQAGGATAKRLACQLAGIADVYVNDAFGSWQSHVSTSEVVRYMPSYAGHLLQSELTGLAALLDAPKRPFVAVVAGSKLDTKIGTLVRIHDAVDHLILGGMVYNAYLCAKHGISVQGVTQEDVEAARALVALDEACPKVVELSHVVHSDRPGGERVEGCFRTVRANEVSGDGWIVDIAPESFESESVHAVLSSAQTIFVNAVMGFMPSFFEGTLALDSAVGRNKAARKLYGGGDTIQEFKSVAPHLYLKAVSDANERYQFFTGGGAVLKAIELGSPFQLGPVRALCDNGGEARCRSYSEECCR